MTDTISMLIPVATVAVCLGLLIILGVAYFMGRRRVKITKATVRQNEERIILTKKSGRNLLDYGDWWTNPTDPKILESILADFTYLFGAVERLAALKPIVQQKG